MKYSLFFVLIFFSTIGLFSCQSDKSSNEIRDTENSIFQDNDPSDSGLKFSNTLSPTPALNILEYLYYYNGGGVAVGDLNNDGLEDVLLTANQSPDRLFLNKGKLKFEDITEKSGLMLLQDWSSGASMDDVNGDGLLDIYICKVDPVNEGNSHNLLYLNNGDLTFTESAKALGLDFSGYSTQASFFDYDQDGDLDMYLLNHSVHSIRSYGTTKKRTERDSLAGDRLYENRMNEGEGKFVEVTQPAGILSSALGYGLGIITTDINQDGLTDIYVGNDFHENDYLYLNQGDKTFKEVMTDRLNHSSKFSMGVDIADMNKDGLPDIFTTDMLPYAADVALKSGGEDTDQIFKIREDLGFSDQYARNHFQLQTPDHHFTDIALMTNTYATDWSWSVLLADYDNNSRNDIFVTNGIVKRPNDLDYINFINEQSDQLNKTLSTEELNQVLKVMPSQKLKNILFLQNENLVFSDLNDSQVSHPTFSNGAAYADFDGDGDLDLIVNNINEPASLLENTTNKKYNFISFELRSTDNKRTNKNTQVQVYYDHQFIQKEYTTTKGYQSSSTHRLHFGLGEQTAIDSVVIIWPGGLKETQNNLAINAHHILVRGKETANYNWSEKTTSNSKLTQFPYTHHENNYADYNYDKMIPELLSREGPAVVKADFNQDGIDDLFLGGARFQEAQLYFGSTKGFIKQPSTKEFKRDAKYEDVDAAVIDFDKDGDMDLYVISGGNDAKELDKQLEDRLYLNNGKGQLNRLPLSLPHTNGSSISVGDADGDGFDDLFIGARSIPGSYGLSPFSFILRNQEGFGLEILKKERYGMVTDSQWADFDGDEDLDLVICGDWMPISVLENQGNGAFIYRSDDLGLGETFGLWNTIELKDLNQDGQLDIIAGNAGTNFKWKASTERPIKLYVADMDNNGQTEPLIFHHYFGRYLPFMSLDKLKSQVPGVRKQFTNYQDYTTVQKIEDFTKLKDDLILDRKIINELRSMVFLSKSGIYQSQPLPQEAQLSSIQDFFITEQNDLLFVGNQLGYLTELGKSQGNSGGKFNVFNPDSGIFSEYSPLALPAGLNTRAIVPLDKHDFLILVNDGPAYLLQH